MAAFTYSEPQPVFKSDATSAGSEKPSFWRRLMNRMIEARMAEARLHVNAHLMTLDDATLAKYGVDRIMIQSGKSRTSAM